MKLQKPVLYAFQELDCDKDVPGGVYVVVEPIDRSDINFLQKISQKQSNSNNTVSTSTANIHIVIGFQSDKSTSENSEISVSFDSALPCSSKSILQQNRLTLKELAMVVVVVGYRPLPRDGAWRKTMEPQKPGNYPGSGPEVVETESPKSEQCKESVAGQCRMR